MEYTQEPLFYTAEEVVTKVTTEVNKAYEDTNFRIQRAKDHLEASIADAVVEVLRDTIKEGVINADTATAIYTAIANKCGWTFDFNFDTVTYTVTVSHKGDVIAEIEDVEAEGEDEACDLVRDDFTLYNADATLTFHYEGNDYDLELNGIEHDLYDYAYELTFEATAQ